MPYVCLSEYACMMALTLCSIVGHFVIILLRVMIRLAVMITLGSSSTESLVAKIMALEDRTVLGER